MKIVKQQNKISVVEIDYDRYGVTKTGFFVVELDWDHGRVRSVGPDNPDGGGRWFGGYSESGVMYVASSLSRKTAISRLRRYSN
jgi:hypothetical protein